jgi:hypothetical protein
MSQEAKEYEKQLYEWALHQRSISLRAAIVTIEATETGITLTVVVDYPEIPKAPEVLDKQPEEKKEAYHMALVNHWKTEASISALKIGPVVLQHPGGINPFLRELAEEETNWVAHLEKKGKAPGPE